jgi:hypothetical protein
MGYTHYWGHSRIIPEDWSRLTADVRKILDMAHRVGHVLAGPMGTGNPVIDDDRISLNGSKLMGEDYETFELRPEAIDFDCCKTGERPYDTVVCAILLRAYSLVRVDVRSDGDMNGDDWAEGRLLYAMAFDEPAPVMAVG